MRSAPKSRPSSQSCAGARPRVSVVIPMYNAGKTILDTLKSVQGQDYGDIEIIVVDDGSCDQGPEIVAAEADKDARIRLVRQENQGVAAARNRGIEESRGQWVTFVDADDELFPRAVSSMLEASHGREIVIGSMDTGDGSASAHREMDPSAACALCLAFWDNRDAAPYSSFRHGVVFRSVWGKLFRGDLIRGRSLRFETGVRFGEDALFMVDAYRAASGIEVLDRPVYRYVCNPASVTRKAHVSMVEGVAVLLGRLYRLSEERPEIGDLYRQSAVREVLTLVRCCAGLDDRSCLAGLEDLTGRPYFKPLMMGYRRHRYSQRRAAEVKNWIVIGLLARGRASEAIAFARIVFGRRA